MGRRGLILALAALAGACGSKPAPAAPRPGVDQLPARVVWDFEHAVLDSKESFVALFDFTAVGEMEILLHRYDLLGRLPDMDDDMREAYAAEDGTPYPPERERRNVGNYYAWLIKPAIARGSCQAMEPHWRWRWLDTFDWYTPTYQAKYLYPEVFRWFRENGFEVVDLPDGPVRVTGVKRLPDGLQRDGIREYRALVAS